MFLAFISIAMFFKLKPSASFVDIPITTGLLFLKCAFAVIVTALSVIALANLASVLPVQGATIKISINPSGPIGSASTIVSTGIFFVILTIFSLKSFAVPNLVSVLLTLLEKICIIF